MFLPNDPLPSDDMVDLDNDSMLGNEGEDTKIDEGLSVLQNRDNAELTVCRAIVAVPVSTSTYPPCIHKYCNFCSWWTTAA